MQSYPNSSIDKILKKIDSVALVICCVLAALIAVTVIVSVFFRFVVNSSLLWGEELTRYLSIWMICLGLSPTLRKNEHVAIESILLKISGFPNHLALVISNLFAFVISGAVAIFGFTATMNNFARHQTTPGLQIEIGYIYLALPVGFGILALNYLFKVFSRKADD